MISGAFISRAADHRGRPSGAPPFPLPRYRTVASPLPVLLGTPQ